MANTGLQCSLRSFVAGISSLGHHSPFYGAVAPAVAYVVQFSHEGDLGGRIFKQIKLGIAVDQSAELYADEADELTSFVDLLEEFLYDRPEIFVESGVADLTLAAESIEVSITNFDGDDGTEFAGVPEFEG